MTRLLFVYIRNNREKEEKFGTYTVETTAVLVYTVILILTYTAAIK